MHCSETALENFCLLHLCGISGILCMFVVVYMHCKTTTSSDQTVSHVEPLNVCHLLGWGAEGVSLALAIGHRIRYVCYWTWTVCVCSL